MAISQHLQFISGAVASGATLVIIGPDGGRFPPPEDGPRYVAVLEVRDGLGAGGGPSRIFPPEASSTQRREPGAALLRVNAGARTLRQVLESLEAEWRRRVPHWPASSELLSADGEPREEAAL